MEPSEHIHRIIVAVILVIYIGCVNYINEISITDKIESVCGEQGSAE